MKEKIKVVEVGGQRWQLRRMSPMDGGYCWQRLMAAMFRSMAGQPSTVAQQPDEAAAKQMEEAVAKSTPEQRLRSACGIGFMHLTYDELKFMQRVSLALTSRMENIAGVDTPMPVVTETGRFAVPDLEDDPALVNELVTEALVFNLASFVQGNAQTTAASS